MAGYGGGSNSRGRTRTRCSYRRGTAGTAARSSIESAIGAPNREDRPAGLPEPTTDNLLITDEATHARDVLSKVPECERYLSAGVEDAA